MKSGFWIALVIGAVILWVSRSYSGTPYLSHDGYQYLDAAAHVASGECLCTRLAHFDEQVGAGKMPAPFTHFPPLYPILIAAVAKTGLSLEAAAYGLSLAGYFITLGMLWWIAGRLGSPQWLIMLASLLWTANAAAVGAASMVGTESLFTAALMVMAALLLQGTVQGGAGNLMAVGLTAAAAYWLRYAGLFLIPVAGLYMVWQARRTGKLWPALPAMGTMVVLMAALQVRNIVHTGSWKGGFTSGGRHPLSEVILGTVKGLIHIPFGDKVAMKGDVWLGLVIVSVIALGWSALRGSRLKTAQGLGMGAGMGWMLAIVAVYSAGITAAALTSIAADFTRYYLPVYPLLIAILTGLLTQVPSSLIRNAALCGLVTGIVVIGARSLQVASPTPPHVVVRRALNQRLEIGETVFDWLRAQTRPQDGIVAVDGQAVHYVLQRPVLSVIDPAFSSRQQDGPGIHKLMEQFGARYLIVFPGGAVPEQAANPFLSGLAEGNAPPSWLRVAGETAAVRVFECGQCRP